MAEPRLAQAPAPDARPYAELARRPPMRTPPGASEPVIPLPSDMGFEPWEHWAWGEIACGRPADMSDYDPARETEEMMRAATRHDPGMGDVWPDHRNLSERFLKLILFHEPWASAATHDRIEIFCARFIGAQDFRGQRARGDLRFWRCRFEGDLDFNSFELDGQLSLHRCWVGGALKAQALSAKDDILLNESVFKIGAHFQSARTDGRFNALNATFEGELNAETLHARGDIYLEGSSFLDDVRFSGAQTDGVFNACNATFGEALEGGSLSARWGIYLRNSRFKGPVRMLGAHTQGQFSASNAVFEASFQASSVQATGGLFLDRATFQGDARFIAARTEGQFSAENAVFESDLIAAWLKVDGGVFIRGGEDDSFGFVPRLNGRSARIGGDLDLKGAEIGGGMLDLRGLDCAGKVDAEAITSKGVGRLDASTFGRSVRLVAARFERNLTAAGAVFNGEVKATNLKVENNLLMRSKAPRTGAGDEEFAFGEEEEAQDEIRGMIDLPGPVFRGPVDLVGAEIGGALDISGAVIEGKLNLTSARLGGDFRLASSRLPPPSWGDHAQLILRNCKVRAIQATGASLLRRSARPDPVRARRREFIETDLSGIEIEKLSGADEGKGGALVDADPRRVLVKWIEAHADYKVSHDPGPYHQIAHALKAAGRPNAARRVLIKGYDHEFACSTTTPGRKAVLGAWNLFSRYGFSAPIPMLWLMGLILAQMGAGLLAEGWLLQPLQLPPPTVVGEWFIGAAANLVPLVNLDPDWPESVLDRRFGDAGQPLVPHWLKQVWFWSSVMGFVVLSYLIAAISGLAKTER
jgi:hypothetical protein